MGNVRNWIPYDQAKLMRDQGLTYRAIGEQLRVSVGRARQLVRVQESRLDGTLPPKVKRTRQIRLKRKPASQDTLDRAIKMLKRYGYTVIAPGV